MGCRLISSCFFVFFIFFSLSSFGASSFEEDGYLLQADPQQLAHESYYSNSITSECKIDSDLEPFQKILKRGMEVILLDSKSKRRKDIYILSLVEKDEKIYLRLCARDMSLLSFVHRSDRYVPFASSTIIEASQTENKQINIGKYSIELDTHKSQVIFTRLINRLKHYYPSH